MRGMRGTDLWNYELKRQCGDSRVFMLRYSTASSLQVLESQQYVDRCTWKEMAFGPLPKQAQGQKTASAILWQHTCCHVDVLAKDRMAIKFTMPVSE